MSKFPSEKAVSEKLEITKLINGTPEINVDAESGDSGYDGSPNRFSSLNGSCGQMENDPVIGIINTKAQQSISENIKPKYQQMIDDKGNRNDVTMTFMKTLSKILKPCRAIRGFSPNMNNDKITIDVMAGHKDDVMTLLKEHYNDVAKRFVVIEQQSSGHFLVNNGTKVANGEIEMGDSLIGQGLGGIKNSYFGTVTCLAQDDGADGQLFLVTANHMITPGNPPNPNDANGEEKPGRFISMYHNRFQEVSNFFCGIFGPLDFEGFLYNVDIAALKLTDDLQTRINADCACRSRELKNVYRGTNNYIQNMLVRKNGASTGLTCGKITNSFYWLRYETTNDFGMGLLVESLDDGQLFADKGDSGALVWSSNGQPLGIISHQTEKYENGQLVKSATYVVRLDRCIDALTMNGYFSDVTCKTHGTPIPDIKDDGQPKVCVQGDIISFEGERQVV